MSAKQAIEVLKVYADGNRLQGLDRIAEACEFAAAFMERRLIELEAETKRLQRELEFNEENG